MKTFWPCDRCHQPVWWDKTWGAIGVLILFSVLSTTAYVNTYGGRRWAAPLSKVEGEWGTHHMFCWRLKRPSIWGKNEQTWPGLIWMVLFPSDTKHNYSISAGHSLPGCFAIRECPSGSSLSLPKYEALRYQEIPLYFLSFSQVLHAPIFCSVCKAISAEIFSEMWVSMWCMRCRSQKNRVVGQTKTVLNAGDVLRIQKHSRARLVLIAK